MRCFVLFVFISFCKKEKPPFASHLKTRGLVIFLHCSYYIYFNLIVLDLSLKFESPSTLNFTSYKIGAMEWR